ncbi:MAG: Riboflavin biosynthesis protein RibD [Paracidovorax wautersii]|uniref:Riboflavin biosynthesis protein RibD n=1 Tax=Paracidovorax wautersii TaxID=1177982 RepID=A0A7V8FLY2_9BURK|nr:MAG: Riboflavin biosynthesis protein RibD [Paracidovorax wautersii]
MTAPIDTALALARSVLGHTNPNPAVGCVVVNAQGEVIGQGATQPVGGPHAEVMALRDAQARGHDTTDATAYVTLEPCAHQGRTGPCCDALIAAGIRRVVASLADPNPLVAGQGFARLRAAGVAVEVGAGEQQARELNLGFLQRMTHGLPWVRMKVAASLDGRTALPDGTSQWITGEAARADGHRWRARACAILTGVGTVLADDPRLDVRLPEGEDAPTRRPRRVIVDSSLRTPPSARLLTVPGPVLIYTTVDDAVRHAPLLARGADIAVLPAHGDGRVDLQAVLHDLGQRATNEVHVEAGRTLNGALLRQGLVDDGLVYLAPKLLGNGLEMAALGTLGALADAPAFDFVDVMTVGADLRLIARAHKHRPNR